MAKCTVLATIVAAAAVGASAQSVLYMPIYANETGINANPNATAIVPVAGWNLQKTFPGKWDNQADPAEAGWTMHLNITANVTSNPAFQHNSRATRISMELKPPAGLIDPQSGNWSVDRAVLDSWRLWIVQYDKRSIAPGGHNNDDGSCSGMLSDECISSIKAKLAGGRAVVQGNDTMSIRSGLTPSCPFTGTAAYRKFSTQFPMWSIGIAVPGSEADTILPGVAIPLDNTFPLNATLYSDEPVEDDKYDGFDNAYDFFGSRPIPFVVIFGHGNGTGYVTGQPLELDHVTVGCIKADTKVGDSIMPSSGIGGTSGRLSTVSLLSMAAMAGTMLLC